MTLQSATPRKQTPTPNLTQEVQLIRQHLIAAINNTEPDGTKKFTKDEFLKIQIEVVGAHQTLLGRLMDTQLSSASRKSYIDVFLETLRDPAISEAAKKAKFVDNTVMNDYFRLIDNKKPALERIRKSL